MMKFHAKYVILTQPVTVNQSFLHFAWVSLVFFSFKLTLKLP